MDEKKISIIITVYNVEPYLSRAIESVLWQTYQNIELILIDDGSDDGSAIICDEYAKKDTRVKVLHKENGGVSTARNAGISMATGDYIGFVDGDDWIERDMFYSMLYACETHHAQMAICRYNQYEGEHCITEEQKNPNYYIKVFNKADGMNAYLSENEDYVIHHAVWNKLIAADIAKEFHFPEGEVTEDILYTTWAFYKANSSVYIDTPYYNYVTNRSGSIMNSNTATRRLEYELPHMRKQILFLRDHGLNDLADVAAYYFYRKLMFYYVEFYAGGKGITDKKESRFCAKELLHQMKAEESEINRLLNLSISTRGDRYRMKLLLHCPLGYRILNALYSNIIVPIKSKG